MSTREFFGRTMTASAMVLAIAFAPSVALAQAAAPAAPSKDPVGSMEQQLHQQQKAAETEMNLQESTGTSGGPHGTEAEAVGDEDMSVLKEELEE